MERAITSATTLAELQAAGQIFGKLREQSRLPPNEVSRLRLEYEKRLDYLEKRDEDDCLVLPHAERPTSRNDEGLLSTLHMAVPTTPGANNDAAATFVRVYGELLHASVEVPPLLEGPAHIRERSFVAVASKVVYTNTPRCTVVSFWESRREKRDKTCQG